MARLFAPQAAYLLRSPSGPHYVRYCATLRSYSRLSA